MAFTITDFYQKNNVAHNVFLTRGSIIGGKPGDRTVRLYIWPRKSVVGKSPRMSEYMNLPPWQTETVKIVYLLNTFFHSY